MNINWKFHKLYKAVMLVSMLSAVVFFVWPADAGVPNDYKPNYDTSANRDKILWIFVEIDAATKIWKDIPRAKFSELSTNFQKVFPKYPQEYSFKVVYEQCIQLSDDLSNYSSWEYLNKLTSFVNNCQKRLTDIIQKFNTQYTVLATIKASPVSGSAPHTVTLDARWSTDPSNETIPSENYYRYYRDIKWNDQTIGKWLVLSHTFTQPGNYLVHLTVRSSNKQTKNIFDWDATVSVDVSPKTANISVYANWQKFKKEKVIKVGTQEAKKWIIFDGTSTLPMWWRQIMSHIWTIESKEGFRYYRENKWKPGLVRVSLPSFGEYSVELTTIDNESNKVTEKYILSVADPIAIIKESPEDWNTSTTFSFDANASYSVISNIRLYRREIFDQNWEKIDTYQWKNIKQNFKKPGSYTIKLTVEDELGQINSDSVQIYVDSTAPIAQFTETPFDNSKSPSKYYFDASASSDLDLQNWADELYYEWNFPEWSQAKVVDTESNNKKILVTFDNPWKYKVKLLLKDKYGKVWEMEKEISVLSNIRPEVIIKPQANYIWWDILFVVKANKKILGYVRDFWDWNIHTIQEDRIKHKYDKAWVYEVKLKVVWEQWVENEIYITVFVWERNYPVAWYKVLDDKSIILRQNEICSYTSWWKTYESPAYQVDRQKEVSIDPSISQNTKWDTDKLNYYFQPKDDDIVKQVLYKKKFDELWCTFVDLTVDDTIVSKQSKSRIRFRVVNSLPKLDNIVLSFPQYWNEMWVWFQQNNVKDTFTEQYDPLIVKAIAQNPIDADSQISYFKRYYYDKNNPANLLEVKITPGDIPYAFFSVPRIAGEYMFGVTIYDIDWWYQSSEDMIGNWPIVFFPPDSSKPDIPIVTLRTTQSAIKVWDEINFEVISRVLSDRPDFIKDRTIYYDFDWDGVRDKITKDDKVTYAYTKVSPETGYRPRAAVAYRWYKWVANWQNVIVRKWLKPMLLFESFDKIVIFRDISIWDVWTKTICMDIKSCKTNENFTVDTWSYFMFDKYPSYGKYYVNMELTDKYANKATKRRNIDIQTWTFNQPVLLSIPRVSSWSKPAEILVWKNLDNTVLFYIVYDKQKECFVDTDIKLDSDGDKIADNDHDFSCNKLYYKKYEQKYESINWRIFYLDPTSGKIDSSDFSVSFLDFAANLDTETKKIYDDINLLIWSLNTENYSGYDNLRNLLITLRDWLVDKSNTKSNVVSLKDYVNKQVDITFTAEQESILNSIFFKLSDKAVVAAQWWNEYEKAKADIIQIVPSSLLDQIELLFQDFEKSVSDITDKDNIVSQQDKRKETLQKLIDFIVLHTATQWQTPKDDQIDKFDFDNQIKPNICKITQFYGIVTKACPSTTEDIKDVPENIKTETETSGGVSRLKIVLWVVLGLTAWFVLLIIIFAIRAKIKQSEDNSEWSTPTPTTQQ